MTSTNRSLQLLGVAAAGQPPSAEDYQAMRDTIAPLLEELRVVEAANIVLTANDEAATDIPDECFGPLSILLANDAGPAFGIPCVTGTDRELKLIRRFAPRPTAVRKASRRRRLTSDAAGGNQVRSQFIAR